ncbi:MAG: hypothetical protein GX444_00755 [Myxococcales bacterium]|nr:hypothetical protein [Myxococcales bacterium]
MQIGPSRTLLLLAFLFAGFVCGCGHPLSDEAVLRRSLSIPSEVRLLGLQASPPADQAGWFGREGLTIEATFGFDPAQFEAFRRQTTEGTSWRPLPVPRELLVKMLGVASRQRGLQTLNEQYQKQNRPEQIRPIPGADEILASWQAPRLPLDAQQGWYRCLTAGDNLLHAVKRECLDKTGDQNDFILAVLDAARRELRVTAYTNY